MAISPDGKTLASGSADNMIRFWDVTSGKEQAPLKAAEISVDSLAFSPDGKTLASGCGGTTIQLWDVGARKSTTLLNDNSPYASLLVVFSSDGKALASGGDCIRAIRLWDVAAGKLIATLEGYDAQGLRAMAFTPDGKTLASMGYHDGLKLWDLATGKNTFEQIPPETVAKLIAKLRAPDFRSRQLANDELIKLGKPVVPALRKAAQTKLELEVKRRLELLVRQIENVRLVLADSVPAAAFSPDGKTMATAKWDNSVKLWALPTGKERAALKGHSAEVCSVVFSPDGMTLATGSADGTIKLWDVAQGKELATLKGHTDKVLSLAFRADSRMLASGSADKSIKLWDTAMDK